MNEKITLQDIVNLLCEKQGIPSKESETFVRTMFDLIEEVLTTEKYVKIKGLGTFKLTEVNSRESVHVNTGERIEIQGHSKVTFTPDTSMKELINKPFSHFETVVLNDGVELEDTIVEETETPDTTDASEMTIPEQKAIPEPSEETVPTEEIPAIEEPIIEQNIEEQPVVNTPETEEPATIIPSDEETIEEVTEVNEEQIEEEPTVEQEIAKESEPEISIENTTSKEEATAEIPEKKEENSVSIEEKKSSGILLGIIIVLVLIILFGFYWLFMRTDTSTEVAPSIPVQEKIVEPAPVEVKEEQPKDTLETVQYVKLSTEELRNERVPSLADTLDYLIIGTKEEYTLQKGETIIRASVKFFGTKKYWPYIVKHNMDSLKDPDNIPAGAHIKIPVLTPKK